MSTTKHTPAPWHTSESEKFICDAQGRCIAQIYYSRWLPLEERRANARLIGAAPELLAALADALALLEYMAADRESAKQHKTLVAARAAIDKAARAP